MARPINNGAVLKYPPFQMNAKDIRRGVISEKEARQEYTRLRAIANKRLERMANAPDADSGILDMYYGQFPTLKEMDPEVLPYQLERLAWFVSSKKSTITGQRAIHEETIETLGEKYPDLADSFRNDPRGKDMALKDFGRFMEGYRASGLDKILDSDQAVQIYKNDIKSGKTGQEILKDLDEFYKKEAEAAKKESKFDQLYKLLQEYGFIEN